MHTHTQTAVTRPMHPFCCGVGKALHREVSLAVADILERLQGFLKSLVQYGCRWVGHLKAVGGALWR